jgi:hypothetical protein
MGQKNSLPLEAIDGFSVEEVNTNANLTVKYLMMYVHCTRVLDPDPDPYPDPDWIRIQFLKLNRNLKTKMCNGSGSGFGLIENTGSGFVSGSGLKSIRIHNPALYSSVL